MSGPAVNVPRRRPTPPIPRKALAVITVLVVLAGSAPYWMNLWVDNLWFRSTGFGKVWSTTLFAQVVVFVVVALCAGLACMGAMRVAVKNAPRVLTGVDPNSPVEQYRKAVLSSSRRQLMFFPLAMGVAAGALSLPNWRTVLAFIHGHSFGVKDPQFGIDWGFYAFTLPFISWVLRLGLTIAGICFVANLVMNWLVGGVRTGDPVAGRKASVAPATRVQLVCLAGIFLLFKAADYWMDRYRLLMTDHEIFTGGSYTDINAVLPARIVLFVVALVVAAAFFSAIWLKDLRIPALATVLMLVAGITISAIWPTVVEQFNVAPNRAVKEREYIARNIEATRAAFAIGDDKVTYMNDWGTSTEGAASTQSVAADAATISNIRLLDPQVLSATFTQQQQLKNFYGFPAELNIDRYESEGQLRDFIVAARELDPTALSGNQNDWINRHTVYTHGNGFVAAPANKVDEVARDAGSSRGGLPVFTVLDLQSGGKPSVQGPDTLNVTVDQPRIYFGPVIGAQKADDYAIVGDDGSGQPREYDTDGSNFTYDGTGGVGLGNIVNRALFAAKYSSMKLLLSDVISQDSKILFNRDPRERVKKVAPWLTTDAVTYPVVVGGRIKWIVDGYTTVQSLPYAQHTAINGVTEDSQSNGRTPNAVSNNIAYMRNSVKAVVDAYDGSVDLYAFDEQDPVLKTWEEVFPGTVKPKSEISEELMDHLRFPEDLFKVQRELLTKYHVSDPGAFFTNDSFWSVPADPTAPESQKSLNQPPYYVVAADPETKKASFQLITPLRGLKREFLAAHMSVSSDPDTYGKMTLRVLPTNTQTQGPKQAQDTMMSSDQISRDRTLWSGTNLLTNGNLLTLPVGDGGILYVEPIYSQRKDQQSAFPKLLRVLTYYNGRVGYAPTIAEALSQVGIDPKAATATGEVGDAVAGQADTQAQTETDAQAQDASAAASEDEVINKLDAAVAAVETAKQSGSFEEYGKALDDLQAALQEYHQATGR